MLVDNLKNINSQADLFAYICKLEEDLLAKERIIDSQIVQIANLHNDVDVLCKKLDEQAKQIPSKKKSKNNK
jgi:hypothetical protein